MLHCNCQHSKTINMHDPIFLCLDSQVACAIFVVAYEVILFVFTLSSLAGTHMIICYRSVTNSRVALLGLPYNCQVMHAELRTTFLEKLTFYTMASAGCTCLPALIRRNCRMIRALKILDHSESVFCPNNGRCRKLKRRQLLLSPKIWIMRIIYIYTHIFIIKFCYCNSLKSHQNSA